MLLALIIFFQISEKVVKENAKNSVHQLLSQQNDIINLQLSQVKNSMMQLVIDEELFNIFNNQLPTDDLDLLKLDRRVNRILDKYLGQYSFLYSTLLVTDNFQFGTYDVTAGKQAQFKDTDLYKEALANKGSLGWVSTYHVTEQYELQELQGVGQLYPYLFSGVKKLNLTKVITESSNTQGSILMEGLSDPVKAPILVVNVDIAYLTDQYDNILSGEGIQYFIVDDRDTIVAHKEEDYIGAKLPTLISEGIQENSEYGYITLDKREYIYAQDTQDETGWTGILLVPVKSATGNLNKINRFIVAILIILLILCTFLLATYFSAVMTRPIAKLVKGLRAMGRSNEVIQLSIEREDEFGELMENFNAMNSRIHQLIEENYTSKLNEKEAQILALKNQINPHFLSNTLNVINWMALENNQREISQVIVNLSLMLKYTQKDGGQLVPFEEELNWLKSYIEIMRVRYEETFLVTYKFPVELMAVEVPQMFLQPFIENAVMHGFKDRHQQGMLKLYGSVEKETITFSVEDNGCGFITEELRGEGHIGITNSIQRIKLIYGERAKVSIDSEMDKGTRVTVSLPRNKKSPPL